MILDDTYKNISPHDSLISSYLDIATCAKCKHAESSVVRSIRAMINQYFGEVLRPLDSYTVLFEWFRTIFLNVKWQVILGDTYKIHFFKNLSVFGGGIDAPTFLYNSF